jgi:hypothetical protein
MPRGLWLGMVLRGAAGLGWGLGATVKLYELGRLSSGAAARLAGIPRVLFLSKLADYGVDTFDLTDDELERQAPLADVMITARTDPTRTAPPPRAGGAPRRKPQGHAPLQRQQPERAEDAFSSGFPSCGRRILG